MKIIRCDLFKEKINPNKEQFIEDILKRIILICKEDKSFESNEKMKKLELLETNLYSKKKRLDNLLIRSVELKNNLKSKISDIENINFKVKTTLLEALGNG